MHTLLIDHQREVAELCRRFKVARLELFGSAASGGFDPARSDLDFVVQFQDVPEAAVFDLYFGLLHGLEDLFGRRVDLLDRAAIRSPYIVSAVMNEAQPIYAA